MEKFDSFEKIRSWQKAREFNKRIYLVTEEERFKRDFGLARQIRRASISVSSNIAEGFERNSDKEFVHFLFVAKALAGEVRSQLYLAYDLDYVDEPLFKELISEISKISQLISGLIKYLQKS